MASAWIPVLICLAVISQESTVSFGADHTTGPLRRLFEWMLDRRFTADEWWHLHFAIRKCGHFIGYGLLSAAGFRALWMSSKLTPDSVRRRFGCHALAMLGTLLVASADELHQWALPNRSGSLVDVGIDCAGGLLLQMLIWLWMRRA